MTGKYGISAIVAVLVLTTMPIQAQFGGIKKLGTKVKNAAVGGANGVASGASGKPSSNNQSQSDEFADSSGTNAKVKDGEAAVVPTARSEADATAKVKAYFNSKDIDFMVNADTGRIVTDWYGEHRCGIGLNRCAVRAMVRVVSEGGKTSLRAQIFERKREGGISEKPWNEISKSNGDKSAELAAALQQFIGEHP